MKKLLTLLLLLPAFVFANKTIELNANNTINFNQDFNAMFVAKKQIEAISLCSKNVGKDIYVTLYSPGGSISAGQLFFDTLNALPCKFHTVTIAAASMGYQTVQNLGKRYIINSGLLMSHRAHIRGLSGELGGELDQVIKNLKDNVAEMEQIAADRIGISLNDYQTLIRDELWLTAKESVKSNHADEIVNVTCDESLMSTTMEIVNTFFGSFLVEYSNCPIITAPISVHGSNSEDDATEFINYSNNFKKRVNLTL